MKVSQSSLKVIKPNGVLDEFNADLLWNLLSEEITASNSSNLIIDMSNVKSLSSMGLTPFISAAYAARGFSKDIYLCSVAPQIRMVFELTQLDKMFEFVEKGTALNGNFL